GRDQGAGPQSGAPDHVRKGVCKLNCGGIGGHSCSTSVRRSGVSVGGHVGDDAVPSEPRAIETTQAPPTDILSLGQREGNVVRRRSAGRPTAGQEPKAYLSSTPKKRA